MREFLSGKDSSRFFKKKALVHQKESLGQEDMEAQQLSQHDKHSLLQEKSRHSPSSLSPATRVKNLASKILPRPRSHQPRSKQSTLESAQGSPKEYSELTTTLDYEELKSSTFSTDEEDTTRDTCSLRLHVLSTNLNRARSLQLPEPEPQAERGVLRQTHSDSKDPEFDAEGDEPVRSESRI